MEPNQHLGEAARALNESALLNEWPVKERAIFAARAQAEATLALAFEQRTNTMAILASIDPSFYGSTSPEEFETINARLGRNQEQQERPKTAAGYLAIPVPTLFTKAEGSHEYEYLFKAADNLRNGYAAGGSGVRNMIASMLTDAAQALVEKEV